MPSTGIEAFSICSLKRFRTRKALANPRGMATRRMHEGHRNHSHTLRSCFLLQPFRGGVRQIPLFRGGEFFREGGVKGSARRPPPRPGLQVAAMCCSSSLAVAAPSAASRCRSPLEMGTFHQPTSGQGQARNQGTRHQLDPLPRLAAEAECRTSSEKRQGAWGGSGGDLSCQPRKGGSENPSNPRKNTRVIAGTDWVHGQ